MAPVEKEASREEDAAPLRVLVTGFGPFAYFGENPSWLAVRPLHGATLESSSGRKVEVQTVQIPVAYSAVLHAIPKIHGNEPSALEAAPWTDPRGDTTGFQDIGKVHGRYDIVLHVGVGRPGPMRIECRARKSGFRITDQKDEFAPRTQKDPMATTGLAGESSGQKFELSRVQALEGADPSTEAHRIQPRYDAPGAPPRGFPENAYPSFQFREEERTDLNVQALHRHLVSFASTNIHVDPAYKDDLISLSEDAGLYLCEYIYYASLAESKRAGSHAKVLFIHCPPVGQPLPTQDATSLVREAIRWIADDLQNLKSPTA